MMPPVPPWAVGDTPEPVSLDIDDFVNVSAYVRLEDDCPDIHYGVLDVQVNFHHEGNLMNVYMLHFFALEENYPTCAAVVQGWKDGFAFPPALTKMRVWYRDRWINVCAQQCVAINDRGVSVYGSNKGYRWRMVHHIISFTMNSPCWRSWTAMLLPSRGRQLVGRLSLGLGCDHQE